MSTRENDAAINFVKKFSKEWALSDYAEGDLVEAVEALIVESEARGAAREREYILGRCKKCGTACWDGFGTCCCGDCARGPRR